MSLDTTASLQSDLRTKFSNVNFDYNHAFGGNVIHVPKEYVVSVLKHFKDSGRFDFLMQSRGADYPERVKRFGRGYELFSSRSGGTRAGKTQVGDGESLPTVIHVWKGGDWFEREIYDMFGVKLMDIRICAACWCISNSWVGPYAKTIPPTAITLHRSFADSFRQ